MGVVHGYWRIDPRTGLRVWVDPHTRAGRSADVRRSGPGSSDDLRALADLYASGDELVHPDDVGDPAVEVDPEDRPGVKHPVPEPSAGRVLAVTFGRLLRNGWRNIYEGPNWRDVYPPDPPMGVRPAQSGTADPEWTEPIEADLSEWFTFGYTPEEARCLHDAGYPADEASEWSAAGFSVTDMTDVYQHCDLDGAITVRDLANRTGRHPTDLVGHVMAGRSETEILRALEAGDDTDPWDDLLL